MKLRSSKLHPLILFSSVVFGQDSWIRINQLGYQNQAIKVAVFVSHGNSLLNRFELVDATNCN